MKKYLTHTLNPTKIYGPYNDHDYKCNICGVYLLEDYFGKFLLITNNGNDVEDDKFSLTCDEWIIRNIIE